MNVIFSPGHYVYAVIKNKTGFFATPEFISPPYYKAGKNCKFSFWYHMNGTSYSSLRLKYRRNSKDSSFWYTRFNHLNKWQQASIDIPACATDFQVLPYYLKCLCKSIKFNKQLKNLERSTTFNSRHYQVKIK